MQCGRQQGWGTHGEALGVILPTARRGWLQRGIITAELVPRTVFFACISTSSRRKHTDTHKPLYANLQSICTAALWQGPLFRPYVQGSQSRPSACCACVCSELCGTRLVNCKSCGVAGGPAWIMTSGRHHAWSCPRYSYSDASWQPRFSDEHDQLVQDMSYHDASS